MSKTPHDKYSEYPMALRKFMDPAFCLFYDDKFSKDEFSVKIIKEALSPKESNHFPFKIAYSLSSQLVLSFAVLSKGAHLTVKIIEAAMSGPKADEFMSQHIDDLEGPNDFHEDENLDEDYELDYDDYPYNEDPYQDDEDYYGEDLDGDDDEDYEDEEMLMGGGNPRNYLGQKVDEKYPIKSPFAGSMWKRNAGMTSMQKEVQKEINADLVKSIKSGSINIFQKNEPKKDKKAEVAAPKIKIEPLTFEDRLEAEKKKKEEKEEDEWQTDSEEEN